MAVVMEQTVQIYCKNDKQFHTYRCGTSLLDVYRDLNIKLKYPVLAARVNYKAEDLNFAVYKPKDIEFIDAGSSSGYRVYMRSLSCIMARALYDIDPTATLRIEHPICRGYYCCINGRDNKVSLETIAKLKQRMLEIIDADMPIVSEEKQTPMVAEMFRRRGQMDKVILLETLGIQYARFVRIGDFVDYYNGVLTPSTGYIRLFDLEPYKNGILLRVPDRAKPDVLAEYEDQSLMFDMFDEFITWNKQIMGFSNVGDFNVEAKSNSIYNVVKIAEALQERKIVQIADMIYARQPQSRFVMVSGPSSSGKTTFSKRLKIQLMVAGLKPIVLSLDNYFVNRVDTPLDADGNWDFEHIDALDRKLLTEQLDKLLRGEEVEIPFFNFEDGKRYFRGDKLKLNSDNVLIIEGIHALNPDLTTIPREAMFKVYVSTLTTISLDNHNWIPTHDTRLLRRIVRDYRYRGYSGRETIARAPSVRRGEERWIYPYQEQADVMFNSALLFELAVLKRHAEPILSEVPQSCEEYTEAHRLLKFLKYFTPIHDREIPPTSLLREFLGGSSFRY